MLIWVKRHYTSDETTKEITQQKPAEASSSTSTAEACQHLSFHNKGSSARFRRFTCTNPECKFTWNVERNAEAALDPKTCKHVDRDNRGSTKDLRRTYCVGRKTYIDEVAQEIHKH